METNKEINETIIKKPLTPEGREYFIYRITNLLNNKIYIGQTVNPDSRWYGHKWAAKQPDDNKQAITRSIRKHGKDNFVFEIIARPLEQTQKAINDLETLLIAQENACDMKIGYNILPGGGGMIQTPEIRRKRTASRLKYFETHDSPMKGKNLPKEWCDNISKASMGKPGTNLGKTFEPEHSLKISQAQIGKENLKGRKFTPEIEKEICRLYTDGELSIGDIAILYECVKSLIRSILIRNNIERRVYGGGTKVANTLRRQFTEEQELEICEMFKSSRYSISSIALKFEKGKTTIRDVLVRNGLLK